MAIRNRRRVTAWEITTDWSRHRRSLLLAVLGGTFIASFIGFASSGNVAAFFLNLGAGGIIILLTVFVVEKILKSYESERTFYVRFALYRECVWSYNQLATLWADMIGDCGVEIPAAANSIFDPALCIIVDSHLKLDSPARVFPPRPWHVWIKERTGGIQNNLNQVLQRYSIHVEPKLALAIHNLIHSPFFQMVGSYDAFRVARGGQQQFGFGPLLYVEFFVEFERFRTCVIELGQEFQGLEGFFQPRGPDINSVRAGIRRKLGGAGGRWEAVAP